MVAMMEPVEGAEGRREEMKHRRLRTERTPLENGLKHLSVMIKGSHRMDQLRSS